MTKLPDFGWITALYLGLLLFGIVFNAITAWADRKGYMEGYTAFFVAGGAFVTLAATAILSPLYMLLTLGCFTASGLPMILGSVWRHIEKRERSKQSLREETRS